jgi:ABC-type nitrate/sulfonate/bicarbonate transport system substrate-binding protein
VRRRRPLSFLLLLLACAATVAACGTGSSDETRPGTSVKLLLDFTPNAAHAGIYLAKERGYDEAEGVTIGIRKPGASTDALKLLQAGRVDMAILDIHDLGLAREKGADLVGVMAVVQRPLAAVLAQPSIRRPRDLVGRRVGVTGLPSDTAVLDSVVRGDGGDPAKVKATTIGFDAVKAMLAGRVAGATAFWDVEGVELRAKRPQIREFRVDDFGAPRYPELVLCVTRETLQDERTTVLAVIRALQRGYRETQIDPASAVLAMTQAVPDLDRRALAAQLDAVAPAFQAGTTVYGALDPDALRAWARWDQRFGILERRPDVSQAFDTSLVQAQPNLSD